MQLTIGVFVLTFVALGRCGFDDPPCDPCASAVCLAVPDAICTNENCVAVFLYEGGAPVECDEYCAYEDSKGVEKFVSVGATLTYTVKCPVGYKVEGDTDRKCMSRLKWSGVKPECKASVISSEQCDVECNPNPCATATCSASTRAVCHCDQCLPVFLDQDVIINCNDFCTLKQQEGFVSQQNIRTIPVGATLEYGLTCSKGYKVSGTTELTCLAPEKWSAPLPTCQQIPRYCARKSKKLPKNGRQEMDEEPIVVGSIIEFYCNIGYKRVGPASITCEGSKKWSGKVPKCVKMCKNLKNCLVNPCDTEVCRGVPDAVCRPNYCGGCFADFYVGDKRITDKECEEPMCRALCPRDACTNYKCLKHGVFSCVPDTCNRCTPMFYNKFGARIDDDLCSRKCLMKCQEKSCTCDMYPNSVTCAVTDDCGTCKRSYTRGSEMLSQPQCTRSCSDGSDMDCRPNSCMGAVCPQHPDAVCVVNNCGECSATFYVDDKQVMCEDSCPVALSECLVNPCDAPSCRGAPMATCKANYCGGCNAEWYIGDRRATDKECQKPLCRMGCPPDVCDNFQCDGHPVFTCVPNTCNRCSPMFYQPDEKRIPDNLCGKKSCEYKSSTGQTKTMPIGGALRYQIACPAGYEISGSLSVSCIDHNTWSDEKPTCKPPQTTDCSECDVNLCEGASCAAMATAQCSCSKCMPIFKQGDRIIDCDNYCSYPGSNGEDKTIPVGASLEYTLKCPIGKTLIGETRLTCLSHMKWSGEFPHCA